MSENSTWTREKWQQTTAALMRRAATDAAFRAKCLADAKAAVKEISGLDLHANAKLRFAEPQEGLVLTLPALRTTAELSDRELAAFAGGVNGVDWPFNSYYTKTRNVYC